MTDRQKLIEKLVAVIAPYSTAFRLDIAVAIADAFPQMIGMVEKDAETDEQGGAL